MDEVEKLILSLKSEKVQTRRDSAYLLGNKEDSRAIQPLSQALEDNDFYVRERARVSLRQLDDDWQRFRMNKVWAIILGIGIHLLVFNRITKIDDERVFDYILYQFAIFCMQFFLFCALEILVRNLYEYGEKERSLIFSYLTLGNSIVPPIVYIVYLVILHPK